MSIDIKGIDRKKLLIEMWKNAPIASFFMFSGIPAPPLEESELEDACNNKYIDYMCGRPIKTMFDETNIISVGGYNRDAGEGALERIVEKLRKE
jgi:hypothetical protein